MRPTKLTDEVQARIVGFLRMGNYRHIAAGAAGVSARSFREWMAKGRRLPKSRYGRFRRAVKEAETQAEARLVGLIAQKAPDDVGAAKWLLTHRHARRWSDKHRVELTGKNGAPIETESHHAVRVEPDPSHLASVLDVFSRTGVLSLAGADDGAAHAPAAEADEVHPPSPAPDPAGLPPTE